MTEEPSNEQSIEKLISILQVVDLDFECLNCCEIIPGFISKLSGKLQNLVDKQSEKDDFFEIEFNLDKENYSSSVFTPLNIIHKDRITIHNETPYELLSSKKLQSNQKSLFDKTPQKLINFRNSSNLFDNSNKKEMSEILKSSLNNKKNKNKNDSSFLFLQNKLNIDDQFLNKKEFFDDDKSQSSHNKKNNKSPIVNLLNTPHHSNKSDLLLKCHNFFQNSLVKLKNSNSKNDDKSLNLCKMVKDAKSEVEKTIKSSPYSSKMNSNKKSKRHNNHIISPFNKYSRSNSKLFQSNQKSLNLNKLHGNKSLNHSVKKFEFSQGFSNMEHLFPFLDKFDLQKTTDTKKEISSPEKIQNIFCLGKREYSIENLQENTNLQKKKN